VSTGVDNRWFERAFASIQDGIGLRPFVEKLDGARHGFTKQLDEQYGDPYYSRLVYLKASNYLLARLHHERRHLRLTARPVTLMHDPSNSCQLHCPGCVHTDNEAFKRAIDWPSGVMHPEAYARVWREHAPFALGGVLYNYGEPLLNKRLGEFIRTAKSYGLAVWLSSNLSLRCDLEAFVQASPDRIVVGLDGTTQESYSKFRRGGDIDLVLENLRALVETKRRLGTNRPIIVWRFLTFEHNVHEVGDAIRMARKIGVDQISISAPFDVSADAPEVRVAHSRRQGHHRIVPSRERAPALSSLLEPRPEVEELYEEGWMSRLVEDTGEPHSPADTSTCTWLYYNLTTDARGRVLPCCMAPGSARRLVFGSIDDTKSPVFNADDFVSARESFADRAAHDARDLEAPTYCAACSQQPSLTYGTSAGLKSLLELDPDRVVIGRKAQQRKIKQWP
jgi:pyruvate-formate lyase-activating enzyme